MYPVILKIQVSVALTPMVKQDLNNFLANTRHRWATYFAYAFILKQKFPIDGNMLMSGPCLYSNHIRLTVMV